jgi:hypothetical protein
LAVIAVVIDGRKLYEQARRVTIRRQPPIA